MTRNEHIDLIKVLSIALLNGDDTKPYNFTSPSYGSVVDYASILKMYNNILQSYLKEYA